MTVKIYQSLENVITDHSHNCYVIRNYDSSTTTSAIARVFHEMSCMRRTPLRLPIKFRPSLLVFMGPLRIKTSSGLIIIQYTQRLNIGRGAVSKQFFDRKQCFQYSAITSALAFRKECKTLKITKSEGHIKKLCVPRV